MVGPLSLLKPSALLERRAGRAVARPGRRVVFLDGEVGVAGAAAKMHVFACVQLAVVDRLAAPVGRAAFGEGFEGLFFAQFGDWHGNTPLCCLSARTMT